MSRPARDALDLALAFPAPSAAPGTGPAPGRDMPWPEAHRAAARAALPLDPAELPLAACPGTVLAEPLTAATDLPAFDTAAMDGWAVAGPGPWTLRPHPGTAGRDPLTTLADGTAAPVATGARVPAGATAVLRSEHGRAGDGRLTATVRDPDPGRDIRPRGGECRSGEPLLEAGSEVTPAVLGLAAAAGRDTLLVVPRPKVALLVLGDELLDSGPSRDALVRDALGPLLAAWLPLLDAETVAHHRVPDTREALARAVTEAAGTADVVVTTGGTASGPADFVHPVLAGLGAELLVDGVAVRPGHPMLLARLTDRRAHLVGLPGNPLAAVAGAATLLVPLLAALSGRPAPSRPGELPGGTARLAEPVPAAAGSATAATVRLLPAAGTAAGIVPLRFDGPAMLRSLAAADLLAAVPASGLAAGEPVTVLPLPGRRAPNLRGEPR